MLFNILHPTDLVPVACIALLAWLLYQSCKPSYLLGLPIIGLKEGKWFFPTLHRAWKNAWNFRGVMHETYDKYPDEPVIVPTLTSTWVLLPSKDTQWLADRPESELSMHQQLADVFQTDYTVMDSDLVHRPFHHPLIVTTLTSQVGNLVPDVIDEAAWMFAQQWGTNTDEWKEVSVYETMRHIVNSATNRVFVGLPACRDPVLADAGMGYAQDVPVSGALLRCLPRWIKPFLAPLITLRGRYRTHRFCNRIKPTIERRLRDFNARRADPEANKRLGPPPNDWLQWSIAQAKDIGDPTLWRPRKLGERILLLLFAAIHTTSFTITEAILDLVCHNKPEHIAGLREEISAVLAEHGGEWNKRSLAKMVRLDSTLRESMRLNSLMLMGLGRKVTAQDGLDTPSGVHVPRGATVMVPSYSVLHDKAVYGEDAEEYRPFRFAEQRSDQNVGYVERARKAFPTTSKEYLAFGHG